MTRSHDDVVQDQFGPRAAAYVQSTVHAAGEDLDALESSARREAPKRALDLGAGGGHVAYRLALHASSVVALDLSAEMMAAVANAARDRGLANIETCVAPTEDMPFEAETFDFLASRFSAHHWRDFEAGLREARRILKIGATAIFIDVVSPGQAALDTHLQAVELLRDPSHVRDYTAIQWQAALARAGFGVRKFEARRLRMDFSTWVARMQTSETHRMAIRSLQQQTTSGTAAYFEIEPDGSFTLDTLQLEVMAV
jgi:ubiquinone/menaquinone biosynthesis C-methylase UbiE